jgi:hypothetical protein
MLKAGTGIADISPKKGVQLAGYPHCPRPNEGIHDPLYASALYLNDGKNDIVIVTLDLLSIGKDIVRELREETGKHICFSVSHTHSAPWGSETLACEHAEGIVRNPEYIAELKEKLRGTIGRAVSNTFDAVIGTGIGHCGSSRGVGGNRREKGGAADDSVNVLCVKDTGGAVRAVLVNYTLHPTYLHADNLLVSADYPGYIRQYFRLTRPDAVVLFSQGTSGDQSSRYFRTGQSFEEAVRAGTLIGAEADRVIEAMAFSGDAKISVKSFTLNDMPMKAFPAKAEALKNKLKAEKAFDAAKDKGYIAMRNAELAMFGAQNAYVFSEMAESGYTSPELPYEVQLLTIGDALIAALQGEIFVRYGLEIKRLSPRAKTFVFSVSNGYAPGYIYTPEAGAAGGYEVGTSMFAANAGEHLLKRMGRELDV